MGGEGQIETAFAKLTGRRATPEQRERFYRLRDALQLQDNDAFWAIVMALDHYDASFRVYPERVAQVTDEALSRVRETCSAVAQHEVAMVQRALVERVASESVRVARKAAQRPIAWHWIAVVAASQVLFGALCVAAGCRLAGVGQLRVPAPVLAARPRDIVGCVLSMPAGWMTVALLMPAALRGARDAWAMAVDRSSQGKDKLFGWLLLAVCVIGFFACATLVVEAI